MRRRCHGSLIELTLLLHCRCGDEESKEAAVTVVGVGMQCINMEIG